MSISIADAPVGSARRRRTRYPLHVTLSVAFAVLVTVFGTALIVFNFNENREITLLAADDLTDRIGRQVAMSIAGVYVPAQNLVDIASRALSSDANTLNERLESVPLLTEALRQMPNLASIFVGYDDGDFFLVRPLRDRFATPGLNIPPEARWLIQSVETSRTGGLDERILFVDDELSVLAQASPRQRGYDPRERDWYQAAITTDRPVTSEFYVFFTTREPGVTFARRLAGGAAVVGVDLNLSEFATSLGEQRVTPSTRVAVVSGDGTIVGLAGPGGAIAPVREIGENRVELLGLSDLDDETYQALTARFTRDDPSGRYALRREGRDWMASISPLPSRQAQGTYLAMLIPYDELLADVERVRDQSLLLSLVVLALVLGATVVLSRHISGSLRRLARDAEQIRALRLDTPVELRSRILEVDDLASTMQVMKSSIQQFLAISHALSAEKDYARLLEMILDEACSVARADGGAILLYEEDAKRLETAIVINRRSGIRDIAAAGSANSYPPVELEDGTQGPASLLERHVHHAAEIVSVHDIDGDTRLDYSATRARFERGDYRVHSLLTLPLRDQKGNTIGLLQMMNARSDADRIVGFAPELVTYIGALSSDAAVALDVRRLLKAQKDLLESFIQVIAAAIDAKSPYTHGHCQRVPELARLLSEAAVAAETGPFADFELDEEEWYELYIASWLHDCGKVTTPEYVVDKATKLETIYNRIHEIRTRFEVLLRDAQIDYWRALAQGDQHQASLQEQRDARIQQIREDFAFIAECNAGGEFMADEDIQRVQRIAQQTWVRHLDDRMGLSSDELRRKQSEPMPELPVTEPLLCDRPEHLVPRPEGRHPFGDNRYGFEMAVPAHEFNLGEIYNLCIRKGTLTPEERFKINDHIVQTIIMLEKLPFPRELERVPDWAGNHHEKMDGTGYPRRLTGEQLSVPERIMAIADIFEALTAADRPYKPPKSLSESLRIMSFMRNDGHIDPALFDLFLTSGVYLRYAEEHLDPEQIDRVDIEPLLSGSGNRGSS